MRLRNAAIATLPFLAACESVGNADSVPMVADCSAQSALSPDGKQGVLAYYRPGGYPLLVNEQIDSSDYTGQNTWKWGCGWSHASSPDPAQSGYAMAYDPALHMTVLAGHKTLGWDGTRWSDLHAAPPLNLGGTSMVFDEARGIIVLVDSFPSGVNTWTLDGHSWKRVSTAGPQNEAGAGVAHNPLSRTIMLSGGGAAEGQGGQQATWSWDGSSWTLLQPADSPAGATSVMAYDAATRQMILLTQDSQTWNWSSSTWNQLNIASPPLVPGGRIVYDPARRQVLLWQAGTTRKEVRPGHTPEPGPSSRRDRLATCP